MYKIAIQNNETSEVRIASYDLDWGKYFFYFWVDGNMGCDCNRHLEFGRAKDPKFYEKFPCGSHEKYSALYAELEDGTKIPLDTATDEEYYDLINPEGG